MIRGRFMTSRGDCSEIFELRRQVFVDEQALPASMQRDSEDNMAYYALVFDEDDVPSGTGRLSLRDDHFRIGRVCVRKQARGQGLGDLVLRMLLVRAQELNAPDVELSAQLHVVPFYARFGFQPCGDTFEKHGIKWQPMRVLADEIDVEGSCHKSPSNA